MSVTSSVIFPTSSEGKAVFQRSSFGQAVFNLESESKVKLPFSNNYTYSYLKQENGFFLLQENGDKIIL